MQNPTDATLSIKTSTAGASNTASNSNTTAVNISAAPATTTSTTSDISKDKKDKNESTHIQLAVDLQMVPPIAAAYAADINVGMVATSVSNDNTKNPMTCRERLRIQPFNLKETLDTISNKDSKTEMDIPIPEG